MSEWVFFISVFGLLLAREKYGEIHLFSSQRGLAPFLFQCFHLLWQIPCLIAFFHLVGLLQIPVEGREEMLVFFLLPAAFVLGRFQEESAVFYLCTFCLAVAAIEMGMDTGMFQRLWVGICLAVGVLLFQVLILGLSEKLFLMTVPRSLEGLPAFFIMGALVTMALWGLQKVLV